MNTRFRKSACYVGSALVLVAFWASPPLGSQQATAQIRTGQCEASDIWVRQKGEGGKTVWVRIPGSLITNGHCPISGGVGPGGIGPGNPTGDDCGGGSCPTAPGGPTGETDNPDGDHDPESCVKESLEEHRTDKLANEIADAIRDEVAATVAAGVDVRNTSNPNLNVERATHIWRSPAPDSLVVAAPLIHSGSDRFVDFDEVGRAAVAYFGSLEGYTLLGTLHSQPANDQLGFIPGGTGNLGATDFSNLFPSPQDWRVLTEIAVKLKSDLSQVSHYILGPDGKLREFDLSDQAPHTVFEADELAASSQKDAENKECEE